VRAIPVSAVSNGIQRRSTHHPINIVFFGNATNRPKGIDILENVVPYISGEEDKIQAEACKILGTLKEDLTGFINQPMRISAACNRVPVLDGHTVCVSLRFARRPPPSLSEVRDAIKGYVLETQSLGCPSAPQHAIVVMDEPDRPQPRLDRETDRGYAVSVGRIREDPSGILDIQFVALSHNTVVGAAGSSILKRKRPSSRVISDIGTSSLGN